MLHGKALIQRVASRRPAENETSTVIPLQSDEVQLNLLIPAFRGPEIEGGGRDIIDERNGETEPRQIDSFDVAIASLTRLNSHVRINFGLKVPEFERTLLTARGTNNAPELPRRQTGRADEISIATFRA